MLVSKIVVCRFLDIDAEQRRVQPEGVAEIGLHAQLEIDDLVGSQHVGHYETAAVGARRTARPIQQAGPEALGERNVVELRRSRPPAKRRLENRALGHGLVGRVIRVVRPELLRNVGAETLPVGSPRAGRIAER